MLFVLIKPKLVLTNFKMLFFTVGIRLNLIIDGKSYILTCHDVLDEHIHVKFTFYDDRWHQFLLFCSKTTSGDYSSLYGPIRLEYVCYDDISLQREGAVFIDDACKTHRVIWKFIPSTHTKIEKAWNYHHNIRKTRENVRVNV